MINLPIEVKAVVFDLGGVVVRHKKGLTAIGGKGYIIPNAGGVDWNKPQTFKIVKQIVFGRINERQFYEALLPFMKQRISFLRFREECFASLIWNPFVANFLKSLKRSGYKIGVVSDCDPMFFNEVLKRFGLKPFIDARALSYELGTKKPSPKMWSHVLRGLNLKAGNCVYIDDLQKYIDKAKGLGWKAVRFKGLSALRRDLVKFGVRTKPAPRKPARKKVQKAGSPRKRL